MDTPLAGMNIVVTRPREQAVQLAQRIEQAGGNVVLFPLLEISPAADQQTLQAIVSRLDEVELAIFISPNAVRYGMEAIRAANRALPLNLKQSGGCGEMKIATVGQASAKALRDMGVKEIIAPQDRFDSEALLAQPQLQDVKGWRVVIFRGDGGRELLGDTLKARGALVEYAECYRRSKHTQDAHALFGADPHAITVTSSEALHNLWDMFDADGRTWLAAIPLFVPHARIAKAAQPMGWREVIETAGGDDGLLSGLVGWASQTTKGRGQRTALDAAGPHVTI